ncbi:MAG: DUF924 family protein [Pseudolabrys sp.]|nr:DUF924 family protein [Pseudolabrys sp.]MBV9954752.1 DUF924 family protein [Pseudolabrys sp.]
MNTSAPSGPAARPAEIVAFWREAGPEKWFKKDAAFDAEITRRFLAAHEAAAAGKLKSWEESPEGALALLILLDQFPRNMFRNSARAFATDAQARAVTAAALIQGFDSQVGDMRGFFYLPFQHSEDLADQETGIKLYAAAGDADGLKWARIHADIIREFGRFPHRNAVLGRAMTAPEQAFLDAGGFSG